MQTDVLIVGADPTGLALALWLTRLGVRVRIIDRSDGPSELPLSFAVQARALEWYDQIGFAQSAAKRGVRLSELNLHEDGVKIARIPFGDFGRSLSPFPYILILLQDKHEKLLMTQLAEAGVEVERTTELVEFTDDGERIRARLKRSGGGDEHCDAAYVCGCDGSHLAIGNLIRASAEGGTYEQTFYVADVDATGPLVDGEVHYAMASGDLCRVFPLVGTDRVRLIGRTRDGAKLTEPSTTYAEVAYQLGGATGLKVFMVEWCSTYRAQNRVAAKFRKGRAFLLGDACHWSNPSWSQSLNTGLGDAANLAWKLSAVLKGQASTSLLDTYELERMNAARRIGAMADWIFGIQADPRGQMRSVRHQVAKLMPMLMGVEWVRLRFFRTVSQLTSNYRKGPLSVGRVGPIAGGDRLPWVELTSAADNFAPLQTLRWQVHVYGHIGARLREACARMDLPLYEFSWGANPRRKGLVKNATYLVRPDGYVAYASRRQDPSPIERLLSKFDLKPDIAS